jgi:ABC-type antimicrobial peptide transport system permease subunit
MRKLEPGLAIHRVQTTEELLGSSTSDRRFSMLLFAAFAGLAILLAAIGLYGVVSHAASHRTAEIGIRMALGATASDVKTLMLLEGLKPAIAGVALGLVGAVFASRMLRSQLFHIAPLDPVTFSLVPLMLLAVAALACYIPATCATRLGAALALRAE